MAEQYLGEIRIFAGSTAPTGWAFCDGQILNISDYAALFSLLGKTYGGDGSKTFGLPDLRGRAPVHQRFTGTPMPLGQAGGEANHLLTVAEMPAHVHQAYGRSSSDGQASPANGLWNSAGTNKIFGTVANTNMAAAALDTTGGSQPHSNQQPCLTLNFIIAVTGLYPPQS